MLIAHNEHVEIQPLTGDESANDNCKLFSRQRNFPFPVGKINFHLHFGTSL